MKEGFDPLIRASVSVSELLSWIFLRGGFLSVRIQVFPLQSSFA